MKKLQEQIADLKIWVDEIGDLTEYDAHRVTLLEAALAEALDIAKAVPSTHVLPREWLTWWPGLKSEKAPWDNDKIWVRALTLDDIALQPQKTRLRIRWGGKGAFDYGRLGRRHGRKYAVFVSDASGAKVKIRNIGAAAPYNEVWVIR